MKIYIRSSKDPDNESKKNLIRQLVEKGISMSKLNGKKLSYFKTFYDNIKFKLEGVSFYTGDDEFSIHFDEYDISEIPDDVARYINRNVDGRQIISEADLNYLSSLAEKARDRIEYSVNKLFQKYDADGDIKFGDRGFNITLDGIASIGFSIYFEEFLGMPVKTDTFRDIEFSYQENKCLMKLSKTQLSWLIEKPIEYNESKLDDMFEGLAKKVISWKAYIDSIDTEKVADDLENELRSFESKYKSRFHGLEISNLEVEPVIPRYEYDIDSAYNTKYKFSFNIEVENGLISVYIDTSFESLKDETLEEKILNAIEEDENKSNSDVVLKDYRKYVKLVQEGVNRSKLAGHKAIFKPNDIFEYTPGDYNIFIKLEGVKFPKLDNKNNDTLAVYYSKLSELTDAVKNTINEYFDHGLAIIDDGK